MGQIHELIPKVMAEIGSIGKDNTNKQQGFKFRGIDDVYNTLHPILAKHGVFSVPEVLSEVHEERKTKSGGALIYRIYKIRYTFYAPDGSSIFCIVIGEGMDSGDKAGNKAMAIAHKYAYLQVFSIPTAEEKDPDAQSHEVISQEKPTPPPKDKTDKLGQSNFEKAVSKLKKVVGDEIYYKIIGMHGFEHANEVTEREKQLLFYEDLKLEANRVDREPGSDG